MIKKIKRYFHIWWMMSRNSFISMISNRIAIVVFFLGKLIRFAVFFLFIIFLLKGTKTLAGYNLNQTLFFALTFNLIDVISQFLFREAYRFRPMIVTGSFDLVLVKPISSLFRSLMGGADIIDLITIPPLLIVTFLIGKTLNPSILSVLLYILLLINGFLIATAFHIIVLALAIVTTEIDHTLLIYRDLTGLGRFPVDIYKEPLRGILTYLIPIGVMFTLPAKAIMGIVSFWGVVASFLVGIITLIVSLRIWNVALTKYSGASS